MENASRAPTLVDIVRYNGIHYDDPMSICPQAEDFFAIAALKHSIDKRLG